NQQLRVILLSKWRWYNELLMPVTDMKWMDRYILMSENSTRIIPTVSCRVEILMIYVPIPVRLTVRIKSETRLILPFGKKQNKVILCFGHRPGAKVFQAGI